MANQQRLSSLWILLLIMATLCPGAQHVYSKRGGGFRGRGKGDGDKAPPSRGQGFSKQGLKWAGTAAGMLGGTGIGYGLGFLGRPKHGSGNHKGGSSEQKQQPYYQESQRHSNQSLWRAFVKGAAPASLNTAFHTLGHVVPFLTAVWIRDI
ncbi:unnamed protein product [Menidia menidia]|uniref:(Atlantic silverside) hypothetical protein n=1 Tax=Menidia menidia TaxID=238744 RepID=A0A8S4AGN2_9TELE|nr:unnamed protein product [Menidia menidia]